MKEITHLHSRSIALIAGTLLVGAIGCSKQEEVSNSAPVANDAAVSAETAQPVTESPTVVQPTQDPRAAVAAAEAALKAREYEKAAQTMIQLQRQAALTDQQAQAVQNNMIKLQSDLAAAVASGDPKAKAAADLLRRSAMR